jgi:hypothetical protein
MGKDGSEQIFMSKNDSMEKKILEWLTDQGYPLEMQVATSFRKNGFDVIQSHFYADPEDENFREIDIVATKPEITGITKISFVLECKSSKKKPWVLFTSEHVLTGWNILFSYCINNDSARKALIDKGIDTIIKLPWMEKEGRVAYGLTQAFTRGEDVTFKASTGVLKAAISRKRELIKKSYSPFVFVFPCIIIEGNAFECFVESSGNLSIEKFSKGFYFFPLDIAGEFGTCIQILTTERLNEFMKEAKIVSESLISLLAPDAEKKLNTIK